MVHRGVEVRKEVYTVKVVVQTDSWSAGSSRVSIAADKFKDLRAVVVCVIACVEYA